jgi:hypothetical protein
LLHCDYPDEKYWSPPANHALPESRERSRDRYAKRERWFTIGDDHMQKAATASVAAFGRIGFVSGTQVTHLRMLVGAFVIAGFLIGTVA